MVDHWAARQEATARVTAELGPRPMEPSHFGLACAAVGGAIVILFCAVAGLNTDAFPGAIGITIAVTFLGGYAFERSKVGQWDERHFRLEQQLGAAAASGDVDAER